MGLNIADISIKDISKEKSLRYDVDYLIFQNNFYIKKFYSLNDLFFIIQKTEINLNDIYDDFLYAEIGNVTKQGEVNPVLLNFNERNEINENYFIKIGKGDIIKPNDGDILISKVRPNLKKYVLIDEYNNVYYTSAFIQLKPKKMNKLLYYSLRNIFIKNIISITRQGKGYPTIKEDDLYKLKFDKEIIDKLFNKEKTIINNIEIIEKNISKLKTYIIEQHKIINNIFIEYFNFNNEQFEKLLNVTYYNLPFSQFSNNIDLRYSVKFHRKSGQFVYNELRKITNKKLKDFISEPIILGQSISPENYDENGTNYYISMFDIKSWNFDKENCKTVSDNYYISGFKKTIKKDDIILARSGEGTIGKVAFIDDNSIKGVFADFTMRIRVKNCNPKFVYYYFRTYYFQYLIEINKKGLGNNTNIFPNQLQEFPMLDIPIKKQDKIVKDIETEMEKQNKIIKQIDIERKKIDDIIMNSIK